MNITRDQLCVECGAAYDALLGVDPEGILRQVCLTAAGIPESFNERGVNQMSTDELVATCARAVASMLQRSCPPGAFDFAFLRIRGLSTKLDIPQDLIERALLDKGAVTAIPMYRTFLSGHPIGDDHQIGRQYSFKNEVVVLTDVKQPLLSEP